MPPSDPASMTYRDLQKACKAAGLPAKGKKEVLRQYLTDFLEDPLATLQQSREEKQMKKKEKEKNGGGAWVDWRNHAAREIFLEDLEPNGWLYKLGGKDAKAVFDIYQAQQEEFWDVPFDQFEARFNESTKQAAKRRARSAKEEVFLRHDRVLHPRQCCNDRGERVFDFDEPAKLQLREDIKNKLHKQMTPMELWEHREMYHQHYNLDKFRPRIYQEIRRNKFLNWLEMKRTEKRKDFAAKKASSGIVTFIRN